MVHGLGLMDWRDLTVIGFGIWFVLGVAPHVESFIRWFRR